jgi:hypothetical protein
MYYVTLGNAGAYEPGFPDSTSVVPNPLWGLVINTGPFSNLQAIGFQDHNYWTGTEASSFQALNFNFYNGFQDTFLQSKPYYAWAVRSGDLPLLAAVPVPAAVWLFGSGLLGLIGIARRKAA